MWFSDPFSSAHGIAASYGAEAQGSQASARPMADKRTARQAMDRRLIEAADLDSQLEEILDEVWRQETFERTHPFTCGVIREAFRRRERGV